jgi:hypothetical protein
LVFIEMIMWFLSLILCCIYWFAYVESPLYPWNGIIWSGCMISNVLLNLVFKHFLEDFGIYVHQAYWSKDFFCVCMLLQIMLAL